ncbi:universal stress protein [Streptomyces sp. NPDC008313]|uniref:universal stress protein n=1 Tax=Streptomyces sp. NPDC008313 TaxID=3364826 RepID=UPI0036E8F267
MREHVVAGADGSAGSREAVDWAAREAALRGVPLLVVHAVTPAGDAAGEPDRTAHRLAGWHPELRVGVLRLTGDPVAGLLSSARAGDLLVLGAGGGDAGADGTGRSGSAAPGPVALAVAEQADTAVVLMPDGRARTHGGGDPATAEGREAVAGDEDGRHAKGSGAAGYVRDGWDTGGPAAGLDPSGGRREIAVGVDARRPSGTVGPDTDLALGFAFDEAARTGALLRAVRAWELPAGAAARFPFGLPEQDRGAWEDQETHGLMDALRPWREKYPDVPVWEDTVLLGAAGALVHAAGRSALVVVGREGGTLGPVARALVAGAACPVAVVPG